MGSNPRSDTMVWGLGASSVGRWYKQSWVSSLLLASREKVEFYSAEDHGEKRSE